MKYRVLQLACLTTLLACGGRAVLDADDAPAPSSDGGTNAPRTAHDGDASTADATTARDGGPSARDAGTTSRDAAPDADAAVCRSCGDAACVDTMTDPANCGGCDRACSGTCTGGRCLTVLAHASSPVALALDATNVYFTSYDGKVNEVPIAGGPTKVLVAGLRAPWGIAVDGTTVYYADPAIFFNYRGALIGSVPVGGGAATTLVSDQIGGVHLAIGAGKLFWDHSGRERSTASAIQYVPLSGGAPSGLVNTSSRGFVSVQGMAIADDTLFYSEDGTGILRVPLTGGAPTVVARLPSGSVAVDATHVYATSAGSIVKVARGGGLVTTLATGQYSPTSIAVDATDVYWTNYYGIDESSVLRVPIAGGQVTTLAANQGNTEAVAVDGENVYWLCSTGNGSVRKMNK